MKLLITIIGIIVAIASHLIAIWSVISTRKKYKENEFLKKREQYRDEYSKRTRNLRRKYYESN